MAFRALSAEMRSAAIIAAKVTSFKAYVLAFARMGAVALVAVPTVHTKFEQSNPQACEYAGRGEQTMSKKDSIALADMILAHNAAFGQDQMENRFNAMHLIALAEWCREQNPRFLRERWLDYIAGKCGKNGGKNAA